MNLIPIRNEILFTTMSQTLNSISHLTRIEFEVPFGIETPGYRHESPM